LARLKGFERITPVDEALSVFVETLKLKRLKAVSAEVEEALGRVTAENILAPADLPPFDRSAVDGYAVRAQDTFEASQFKPKALLLPRRDLARQGEAKPVWTGNALPKGADAVVMLERTKEVKHGIEVLATVTPGENVSKKGEDVHKDETVVESGVRLQPHHLGLLAGLGMTHVKVVEKPKVAILSTGSELVPMGETPEPNQIIDSNKLILSSLCRELGAEPVNLGIAKDDTDEIATRIQEGSEKVDAIITTGGTSVGAADLVPSAINKLGKPGVVVHGVAMRPAMPTALAVVKEKPVFVLSGYPVAAMFGFEVFARPVILKLLGIESEPRPMLRARLTRRVAGVLGRQVYLRVYAFKDEENEFLAEPIRTRGSGLLTSMTRANGYVVIPEDREGLEEGETVVVRLFDKIGERARV